MVNRPSIDEINKRIDSALDRAKRLELIITVMSASLFFVGLAIFLIGFWLDKNVAIGAGAAVELTILWPINKLIQIREQNIKLGVIPSLTLTIDNEADQVKVLLRLLEQI